MVTVMLSLALAAGLPIRQTPSPALEGVVVNGSRMNAPAVQTEVILRAGRGSSLQQVATTQTDAQGRFAFRDVVCDASLEYVAGANHCSIHYPGPRLQIEPGRTAAVVKLIVYDAVTAPSPLRADKYEIDVHVQPARLDITETLWIQNSSLTTFVGQPDQDSFAETLRLAIPNSFQRVTFHQEFFGRRFKLGDKCVVTDIPWTPGKREVKFTYQIPRAEKGPSFERLVDLPCADIRVRVRGDDLKQVDCSLPRVEGGADFEFASVGSALPSGTMIRLQMGGAARPWVATARWIGLMALTILILATAAYARMRSLIAKAQPEASNCQTSAQPSQTRVKHERRAA